MYFNVTNRIDVKTSAIELAEVKRLTMFDYLKKVKQSDKFSSCIVELDENYAHHDLEQKFGFKDRIINLFEYFQGLKPQSIKKEKALINRIFLHQSYHFKNRDNLVDIYESQDGRITLGCLKDRVYYADYKDSWGFLDRREFYKNGVLSHTHVFDDKYRVVCKEYYDNNGKPKLTLYYRGSSDTETVLTLIYLVTNNGLKVFNSMNELIAYFFKQLAEQKPNSTFLFDRSIPILDAIQLEQIPAKKIFVFHSRYKDEHGKIMPVYQNIANQIKNNSLDELIVSTNKEKADIVKLAKIASTKINVIPVTYIEDVVPKDYAQRDKNKLILVSRVSEEKRVIDAIRAVIKLKKQFHNIYLDIWGYGDDYNGNQYLDEVKDLIDNQNASKYIRLKGYSHNLTKEYDTAAIQLLTSKYEGFSMSLLEGQSHGVPAVSYDVEYGPSDIIEQNRSGFLVKAGSVNDLVKKIRLLLSDRDKAAEFSKQAYEASKRYSFGKIVDKWLSLEKIK
ncbi:glycosyltransferase [Lactobacillus sp. ESL0701]|uniref:glycosyltransferase n=1 Tax=Lactobacillus sp. ESL0701 TaxID=2983217 RepID=UPI0023F6A41E|nr:glycosyltransferase [Lactobacillus sp. ESL0701]MDF7671833.1 glycosyltransferase [Lactobacillus sp. ESL0701]